MSEDRKIGLDEIEGGKPLKTNSRRNSTPLPVVICTRSVESAGSYPMKTRTATLIRLSVAPVSSQPHDGVSRRSGQFHRDDNQSMRGIE